MLGLMGCNPEQTWSRAAGVMPGLIAPPSSDKWLRRSSYATENYPLDLAGRAQAFQKLVAGGVAVNEALVTSGLMAED